MQPLPALALTGTIDIPNSNSRQQRGSHGAFRYFGKLAPDVTGHVLDLALGIVAQQDALVVDPMCGSGSTLIEASERGLPSIGFDVNPVAVLYALVKTRAINPDGVNRELAQVLNAPEPDEEAVRATFASTRNHERWFTPYARGEVTRLRTAVGARPPSRERDLLLAVLLSRLRRISNASARTGRIFYDPASAVSDIASDFQRAVDELVSRLPERDLDCSIAISDARALPIESGTADITFCHPPYFGLYRFSADVLRFELEIGGWSRKIVNRSEIEEGWKSGDVGRLDLYVSDMTAVLAETARVTRAGGVVALVASNSTLGDHHLPVIDRLAAAAETVELTVHSHLERRAHHGSAKYHRSARDDKVIQQDHVILFKR